MRSATQRLANADAQLSTKEFTELADLRRRLDDVNAGERALADRAFADQRFEGTGRGPWREMWHAAERFAEAADTTFPDPGQDAACPLCQQDIDASARERLGRFKEFVTSDLRQKATDLGDQIEAKLKALPDLNPITTAVHAELRGAPEDLVSLASEGLATLDARLTAAKAAAAGKEHHRDEATITLNALRSYADEQEAVAQGHASLRDEDTQRKVMSELADLQACVAFVQAREQIEKYIMGMQAIAHIDATIAKLNTQRISIKLRELQEVAITDRLRKAVEEEVRELDPVASRIEITGKASKGETVIHLKFKEPCGERISNVLSEGEQRALSLAFFLAEVAVSDERSAIILDDPVSSLDHARRAYLAERLVAESKRRQVVVFTHDMTFVYLLQAMRKASPKAHHEPLELHPGSHSPEQLTAMLDELSSLHAEMSGKHGSDTDAATSPDAEPAIHAVRQPA